MDVVGSLPDQFGQGLEGALLFVIFCKILLGIFLRGLLGIQRDGDLFIGIVVQGFQFPGFVFQIVAVGDDLLPV